jgi:hypothetical protein
MEMPSSPVPRRSLWRVAFVALLKWGTLAIVAESIRVAVRGRVSAFPWLFGLAVCLAVGEVAREVFVRRGFAPVIVRWGSRAAVVTTGLALLVAAWYAS